MSNFYRTFRSANWSNLDFRRMTSDEKVVFVLIHTAEFSSETSVFFCPIAECASATNLTQAKIRKIFKKFEEMDLIFYDYKYEEICVKDFFRNAPANSGIGYERYFTDLEKIKSKKILQALVENTKQYRISLAFFAAMDDLISNLKKEDFLIAKTELTLETVRNASARGRRKSGIGVSDKEECQIPEGEVPKGRKTRIEEPVPEGDPQRNDGGLCPF